MMLRALLIALMGLAVAPSLPADEVDQATEFAKTKSLEQASKETAIPEGPNQPVLEDRESRAAYLASMRTYYDYRSSAYRYRARVFEWQLLSSGVIFVVVVLLVGCGIYFAAVQFHVALRAARTAANAVSPASPPSGPGESSLLNTKLEISTAGVVVNSSVLGVIILILSLAFFYLYLVYVYPISDTI
jgi:hypothetical protein